MKIRVAKSSGFCMGVRRAVEMALDAVHTRKGPIYSYGPLIHNPQAMDLLASKGLVTLESGVEDLEELQGGTIIIRAHGVPPEEKRQMADKGLEILDATCPRVIRVQAIIKKHTAKGYTPIIWGNPDHPEVIGLKGFSEDQGFVVRNVDEIKALPERDKVILVAQTTQNLSRYDDITNAVLSRWPEALVFDTICGATQRRQDDVRNLAAEVDAMVVVGGHSSGNTERLANVAKSEGVPTVHIETEEELDPDWVTKAESIGVTAGASTPNWMIKRVIRKLERIDRRGAPSLRTVSRRILRASILSNVYTAFGAGVLCLAGAMLQGLKPEPEYFAVTFFYVHAMHMLNLFLDKEASKFNDPDRAIFLERHKGVLFASGIFSGVVGLALGLTLSLKVFALLAVMSALGLLYAVPVVPDSLARITRARRLKDIPISKTLSVSGGWAVILSLIPALVYWGYPKWPTLLVCLVIFLLVFIRSALGDIIEVQGDRIVGRETIPIIIGEKNTLILLRVQVCVLTVLLIAGRLTGQLTSLALPMLICAAYAGFYLFRFKRQQNIGSIFFEAQIEGNFILAGLIAWIWSLSNGG